MRSSELNLRLSQLAASYHKQTMRKRLQIAHLLIQEAHRCILQIRDELRESQTATQRRKAKERETATDPKPPVKPVRVAEPTKPKKPKYSGNHAPSARR
ncbi:MAG: hypothetical protein AAFX90_19170 [Pseudomonadota bacterium]